MRIGAAERPAIVGEHRGQRQPPVAIAGQDVAVEVSPSLTFATEAHVTDGLAQLRLTFRATRSWDSDEAFGSFWDWRDFRPVAGAEAHPRNAFVGLKLSNALVAIQWPVLGIASMRPGPPLAHPWEPGARIAGRRRMMRVPCAGEYA